ncbi:MAG: hypothetical protein EZS28_030952 [Streblomastix strix]|uniref:Uncharacterized protein n=1 Tax=Streblomastix strix TaxID=222440 RepID=A0A5J4UU67_9EUKA|nr:MAG: hypothetical protein EZS28_030952 [Streblomastix strix]
MRPMKFKPARHAVSDYCEIQPQTVRNIEREIFKYKEQWIPFWFQWKKQKKMKNEPLTQRQQNQNRKGSSKVDDEYSEEDSSNFALGKVENFQKPRKKPKKKKGA